MRFITLLLGVLLFGCTLASAQSTKGRVMGYLDGSRSDATATIDSMNWANLTDVIYGFVQPDANGNLSDPYSLLSATKTKAKANGVKIHISSGGAAFGTSVFHTIAASTSLSATFASNVATYLSTNQLDGYDIDWEFPQGSDTTLHASLLKTLRAQLNTQGTNDGKYYELAIAVGGQTPNQGVSQGAYHTDYVSNRAFQYVDLVNLMAYDGFAAFAAHSTLTMAEKVIQAYAAKSCPISKMVLGVPFYGWNASRSNYYTYKQLAEVNLTQAYNHSMVTVAGDVYYHNGKDTLQPKIDYIMKQGGVGLFVWSLNYDRFDQYSLLELMTNYIQKYRQNCPIPNLGPSQSLCLGSPITLDCGINTGSGRTITWTKPDASTVTNVRTLSVGTAGTYTVTVDSGGVCANTAQIVLSNTLPTVNIGTDDTLCNPATDTLVSNVIDSKLTYEWTKNGTVLSATSPSLAVSQPGTYRLTISGGNCPSVYDEVVVTSTLPAVEDQLSCSGSTATFTVTSTGSTFSWYANSTTATALATGTTFTTPTLTTTTIYYVYNSASGGTNPVCDTSSAWSSSATYIRYTSNQVINVKYNGYLYTLVSSIWWSMGNNPATSGYWTKGSICTVSCARTPVTANVSICTGVEDVTLVNDVKVYPNPFSDQIIIELGNNMGANTKVEVYALDGSKITSGTQGDQSSQYVIETDALGQGIYFVRIESGGQVWVRKVTK